MKIKFTAGIDGVTKVFKFQIPSLVPPPLVPCHAPFVHAKLRSRQLTWMHIAYKLLYLPYRLMELTSLTGPRFTHVHAKCKSQMRRFYKYMNILHKYIYIEYISMQVQVVITYAN